MAPTAEQLRTILAEIAPMRKRTKAGRKAIKTLTEASGNVLRVVFNDPNHPFTKLVLSEAERVHDVGRFEALFRNGLDSNNRQGRMSWMPSLLCLAVRSELGRDAFIQLLHPVISQNFLRWDAKYLKSRAYSNNDLIEPDGSIGYVGTVFEIIEDLMAHAPTPRRSRRTELNGKEKAPDVVEPDRPAVIPKPDSISQANRPVALPKFEFTEDGVHWDTQFCSLKHKEREMLKLLVEANGADVSCVRLGEIPCDYVAKTKMSLQSALKKKRCPVSIVAHNKGYHLMVNKR